MRHVQRESGMRPGRMTSRALLAFSLVVALLAVGAPAGWAGTHGHPDEGTGGFARAFADPPASARPGTYWWLAPLASMTPAGARADLQAMADAGISGVIPYREEEQFFGLPTDQHGRELLQATLETAKRNRMTVDLSLGITFGIPAHVGRPDLAQQELVYGTAHLGGGETFEGTAPAPTVGGDPDRQRSLVAVVAARCTNRCQTEKPVLLDEASLVDLTDSVRGERVEWTAPAGAGQWVLMSFWQRAAIGGNFGSASVMNHLSVEGARAITDYMDEHTFTPAIRGLLRDAGGVLHEDSIHLQGYHLWTQGFLAEFRERRGYSLRKYLPVSIIANANNFSADPVGMRRHTDSAADFDFADGAGKRIRNDYFQTLSELWEEKYLMTLQRWAHRRGLAFRHQAAYGQTFRSSTAAKLDVPMTEAFQLADTLDGYRAMAGAVHMGDRKRFPIECCVTVTKIEHDNYSTTWQRMLSVIHNSFAAGVNQVYLHGVTYPDAPGAAWPGFNRFTDWVGSGLPGLSEEFGPRMPYWRHMPKLMDFLGREQLVLRQGQPRVDVAMYRQSYWDYGFPLGSTKRFSGDCDRPGGCELLNDHSLERAGYTYEFVGPALFDLPGAGVRRGRLVGHSQGPAYKAMVIDLAQRNHVQGMPVSAARRLLAYARDGLPVVLVGDAPDRTEAYSDRGRDVDVQVTIARLLARSNVRRVATRAGVAGALAQLGVSPAVRPERPSNLLSFRRAAGDASYYFLWNQNRLAPATGEPQPRPEAFEQTVSLEGRGQPFRLDAWSGTITPIATYERQGDRVSVHVRLQPGESTLVALGPERWQRHTLGVDAPELHATRTTADAVAFGPRDELRVRAGHPGRYVTQLSDGRSVRSTVRDVPARRAIATWRLAVEDWQPGASATETRKVPRELELGELRRWSEIPELENVSGVGQYTSRVELGRDWNGSRHGATLTLGPLFDSARLAINGYDAGYVDPDNPVADISRYLRRGANTVEVEIATTLRNRLRTLLPAFASADRQPYGLIGPVHLAPYTVKRLATPRRR